MFVFATKSSTSRGKPRHIQQVYVINDAMILSRNLLPNYNFPEPTPKPPLHVMCATRMIKPIVNPIIIIIHTTIIIHNLISIRVLHSIHAIIFDLFHALLPLGNLFLSFNPIYSIIFNFLHPLFPLGNLLFPLDTIYLVYLFHALFPLGYFFFSLSLTVTVDSTFMFLPCRLMRTLRLVFLSRRLMPTLGLICGLSRRRRRRLRIDLSLSLRLRARIRRLSMDLRLRLSTSGSSLRPAHVSLGRRRERHWGRSRSGDRRSNTRGSGGGGGNGGDEGCDSGGDEGGGLSCCGRGARGDAGLGLGLSLSLFLGLSGLFLGGQGWANLSGHELRGGGARRGLTWRSGGCWLACH